MCVCVCVGGGGGGKVGLPKVQMKDRGGCKNFA